MLVVPIHLHAFYMGQSKRITGLVAKCFILTYMTLGDMAADQFLLGGVGGGNVPLMEFSYVKARTL